MAVKNYVTSISVNNTTRNKLIALSNIYEVTQKDLLSSLVDKEIAQLSSKDKSNFAFILKAIEIKDNPFWHNCCGHQTLPSVYDTFLNAVSSLLLTSVHIS